MVADKVAEFIVKKVKDTKNKYRFETEAPEGERPETFYFPKGLPWKNEGKGGARVTVEEL